MNYAHVFHNGFCAYCKKRRSQVKDINHCPEREEFEARR